MDWELYQRYRATLLLLGVVFVSFLLLIFQRTSVVRHLRTFLVITTLPTERFLSGLKAPPENSPVTESSTPSSVNEPLATVPSWGGPPEARRTVQVLRQENKRLLDLLELQERRWPHAVAAHVVGRDPQRWFQELVLDKGKRDGVSINNPVIAVVGGREGLAGRVTDVADHVAKVMLIQDSLSAVAATAFGVGAEDGVVEGSNSHDLYLRYIDRNSRIKIGDPVLTSGLGENFPEGIPIGWVEEIGLDPRQLFLQARLRPAVQTGGLHVVLILVHSTERPHE
ncbi:MAG: rod shape-determining protein MreC [Elusimicrobiota bacterium]|jgi:hypothetical protein